MARRLDPDFDIWEAARPALESWMARQLGAEARIRDAAGGFVQLGRLIEHIPQLLRESETIAGQLAEGGIRLHPDSVREIAVAQTLRTRHARVALWVAAAGTIGIIALLL